MTVGMIRPDGGRVILDGREVTREPMYIRARRGLGYLPQETSIFRKLTVHQNVMAILETLDLSRKERDARLKDLLNELQLTSLARQKAITLSGGERRRLEITRALVLEADVVDVERPERSISVSNTSGSRKKLVTGISSSRRSAGCGCRSTGCRWCSCREPCCSA